MTAQDVYNELLEDGFVEEFLMKMIDMGMSLPKSKRYSQMNDDDE